MTTEEFIGMVQNQYRLIFNCWYNTTVNPANLEIIIGGTITESYYSHRQNLIHLSFDDAILENAIGDIYNPSWPRWMPDLVHEMLHEYQFKILQESTTEGVELYGLNKQRGFLGEGHDGLFYTAICIHAPYFRLTPEELLGYL